VGFVLSESSLLTPSSFKVTDLDTDAQSRTQAAGTSRASRCRVVERVALAFPALLVLLLTLAPGLPSPDTVKKLLGADSQPDECDPYALPGVLRFDYENQTANFWDPALSQCAARDYMTFLASGSADAVPELEFLRGRVVLFFGDSVDRLCVLPPLLATVLFEPELTSSSHSALEHFCEFCTGELETIDKEHPLMPPLPVGREHAPEGCASPSTSARPAGSSLTRAPARSPRTSQTSHTATRPTGRRPRWACRTCAACADSTSTSSTSFSSASCPRTRP